MTHTPEFLALVQDAKSRIKETTIDAVKEKIKRGDAFHFVDVREDDEWRAGHAKGAIHLGKGIIERDVVNHIPNKSDEVILYCGGGFRSALAADNLQKMGYTNVISMDGGFTGWKNSGGDVTTD
jgi:rhodanese-related sulfurtransferase